MKTKELEGIWLGAALFCAYWSLSLVQGCVYIFLSRGSIFMDYLGFRGWNIWEYKTRFIHPISVTHRELLLTWDFC